MALGLHEIGVDRGLAEPLGGFEPVQPLNQDVALAVVPHLDRRLHAILEDILGKMAHGLGVQRLATRRRHVDVVDLDLLYPQHVDSPALNVAFR
ncbi:hypothetical protein MPL1032_270202 [Mesorhizobium plurifarium]|uniref:Uncharacterized protein n=1 Tax=Mesorhizobium plurifarium TaxID=69974 RepID=A0A0K2W2B2_MESPL|nr:hypothetical protein MPL1032_270202 [Mesorhizobium plurifarium]